MSYGWVSFTTDYGIADGFVAAVKGVIAGIAPDARVLDVTHQVPPQDVRRGAAVLAQTAPWLPPAVHLAVVDPGVGTDRRGVAVVAGRGVLVGPDNGLLLPAADQFGGIAEVVEISASPWRLDTVSATFHGRDVFAPVAARLAAGEPLAEAGAPLEPEELERIELSRARAEDGALVARIVDVDTFGNLALDAGLRDLKGTDIRLADPIAVRSGGRRSPGVFARTFADTRRGGLLLYEDAGGSLAVAVNGGDAAALLGARRGEELRVERT